MKRIEQKLNSIWGWLFTAIAAFGFIATISGHFHHIITLTVGVVMAKVFFNENKKARENEI